MHRIRLVIADRRPIVLQGFTSLLAAQGDFEVVESCLDGASCLEAIRKLAPDVVLLEDGFTDVTTPEMLAAVCAENLPTRLVFFTASVARGDLADAIASGACNAISMSEPPETVMQSLRVAAPQSDQAPARKEANGASGESAPTLLTVNERKVMRLVAEGLSNQAIARQLNASPGIIQVHLDHLFQKLGINNRTELAARAVFYRYGGIGALAAAIYAALDNVQPANANDADAGHAETFAIMAADGTPQVVTIVIHRHKESTSGSTIRATSKARGIANTATTTPAPTAIPAESGVDVSAGTLAALNAARPSMGSHGTFMMAAAGSWIYAIDAAWNGAQASAFGDGLTDVLPSASAAGMAESAPAIPDIRTANLDGSDVRALSDSAIDDWAFAFRTSHGDAIAAGGDGFRIIDANAEDSAGGPGKGYAAQARTGSGSISPGETSQEGPRTANAAAAADKPQHSRQEPADDDPNHGQSQSNAHASENGSASANKHDDADDNPNHGHLQRNSHGPEDGPPKKPAKHDVADAAPDHGQAQPNPSASDDGPPGKKNAKHEAAGDDPDHGHSHPDSHASADGPPNKKPAKHDAADDDPDHGHSQPDPHVSEDGPPGKKNIKQDVADNDPNHGQSQKHAAEEGAPGKKNAKQDAADDEHGSSQQTPNASEDDAAVKHGKQHSAGEDPGHGQSQNNLSATDDDGPAAARPQANHNGLGDDFDRGGPVHEPNNLQPQPGQAGVEHDTVDDAVQAETPVTTKLGDCFHFENANSKVSEFLEVQHELDPIAHGRRAAGHDGPASIEDAGLLGLSPAQHDGGHHASGGQHHAPHDLVV